MPTIRAHIPKLTEGDADLAQRLGVAVALQWADLPPTVQELVLDQACVVETGRPRVELCEQLGAFIREYVAQHGTT